MAAYVVVDFGRGSGAVVAIVTAMAGVAVVLTPLSLS